MKLKKTIAILSASLIIMVIGTVNVVQAQNSGLGVSPTRFTITHMIKNIDYERTFVLSHGEHSEAKFLRLEVDNAIEDWVTTNMGKEFTWPTSSGAGDAQFPIKIIVKAPKDVPNGNYTGAIRIINTSAPKEVAAISGAGASVSLAVAIEADFTLTDEQLLDYDVHSIFVPHQVEEDSPLEISVHIENKGNVKARPSKVEVDFYDQFNEALLESQIIQDLDSVDPATEDGEIIVEVPQTLGIGHFWARVLVYKDATVVKEEDVTFEVVKLGTLQMRGKLLAVRHEPSIDPGEVLKIVADFENTGKIDLAAKLIIEAYKGGSLVEVVESDARGVRIGEKQELTAFFTPPGEGEYRLVSKVEYSGQETPAMETTVVVGDVGAITTNTLLIVVIITLSVVSVILVITVVMFLKRKRGGRPPAVEASSEVKQPPVPAK